MSSEDMLLGKAFGLVVKMSVKTPLRVPHHSACVQFLALASYSSSLPMQTLRHSGWQLKQLRPCHPHGRLGFSSQLLALALATVGIWSMNQYIWIGVIAVCLSLCFLNKFLKNILPSDTHKHDLLREIFLNHSVFFLFFIKKFSQLY